MKARLFGKYRKGSSTLEIVIAFAILTLSLTSVIIMVFGNQSISVDTQTNNEALYKAQTLIEQARADSRQDFNSVVSKTVADPYYTQTLDVQVDPADANIKKVTSTVSWLDAGRNVLVRLITLFTNPVVGPQCSATLSGDWAHPQLLGSADVGQNDGATDIYILGKYAYVAAHPSSSGKPTFYVVDVSDPSVPNLPVLKGIDTGPGLAGVTASGKYAYVANMSTVYQLQVIDVSTPSNPTLVKSLKVTPVGDPAVGQSIFYLNKKIYLGLDNPSGGAEFFVIDVTDPLNPTPKANFEINTQVTGIVVVNNIAYLSVPDDDTTSAREQARVLDVSQADVGVITQLNTVGPNPITYSGEGISLSKDGKTLYLGEGGPSNKPEFSVFDVTNPGSIGAPTKSKFVNATVKAVLTRNNLAFLVTNDPNNGFQIWDLNDLSSMYAGINIQQGSTGGMSCQGNYIYVAQRSNKALQIIGPGPVALDSFSLAIHNAAHAVITTANAGDSVHSAATGAGSAGVPTGSVDFSFYPNAVCGSGAGSAGTTPLVNGVAEPSTIEGPLGAGSYSFKAHYNGSFLYSAADSSCMSLTVAPPPPPFTYTLSNTLPDIPLTSGGASKTQTVTVTMSAGATPQTVTLTPPNPAPGEVIVTPSPASCTPSASAPYTCSVTFTYSATSFASNKNYNNQVVTGSPNAQQSNKYKITVN